MSINKVIISGNLTRDPEIRMAGATPLCQMGVAVNDRRKNNDTGEWEDYANFFDVIMWGNRGEYWARNLSKGSHVVITGRLRWSQWQTAEGQKRSKVEIVADDIESMSPRTGSNAGPASESAASAVAGPDPVPVEVLGDEIPF
ncbi:MAG: single-stranded DNA-binding protein [Actinomycetia bacterium]|nr:single-stranded DNA-binding protein [Actinomycetes bacterium]